MCCSGHGAPITLALQLRAAAPAPTPHPARASTRIRYLGLAALSVRGPFTDQVYELVPLGVLPVDPSDLQALLRTGLFERITDS
jgi:hypothetical protein